MKRTIFSLLSILAVAAFCFCPADTQAAGFGIFTQGASALGQADAVVAHLDSPSAVFFNPALLSRLPGTQIEAGTTLVSASRKFTSDFSGGHFETESKIYYPSTLYASHHLNDKVSFGLGVFNPFGLGTDWGENWEGRYLATQSEMETYNVNPVLSYRLTPSLSIAGGVDFLWMDVKFRNRIPFAPYFADGSQKLEGDGNGYGFNLGLHYAVNDSIALGLSYRSRIKVDIDGTLSFADIPGPFGPYFPQTGAHSSLTLPSQVFGGISFRFCPDLVVEAGFRWEEWSTYDEMRIDLDQAVGGQTSSTIPRDWHNSYALNIGATYTVNETVSLLGGYLYSTNPVPGSTFEPAIPDSNTHLFCIGTNLQFDRLVLSASYGFQLQTDRDKDNAIGAQYYPYDANGKYASYLHLLGVSLTYRF